MYDPRLLGRWRSDGPKTRREIAMRRDFAGASGAALGRLFGNLELRFTRTRCYITVKDHTEVQPYVVLAKDETSVATLSDGGSVIFISKPTGSGYRLETARSGNFFTGSSERPDLSGPPEGGPHDGHA